MVCAYGELKELSAPYPSNSAETALAHRCVSLHIFPLPSGFFRMSPFFFSTSGNKSVVLGAIVTVVVVVVVAVRRIVARESKLKGVKRRVCKRTIVFSLVFQRVRQIGFANGARIFGICRRKNRVCELNIVEYSKLILQAIIKRTSKNKSRTIKVEKIKDKNNDYGETVLK